MLKEILQGRFMRHPLHPILVHIPVGLWICSLVMDIVFLVSGSPSWASASYYTMGIGLIGGALAIPAGIADYIDIPSSTRVKKIATNHLLLNLGIMVLYVANFLLRHAGGTVIISPSEVLISVVSVGLLVFSGYLGGLMVYEYGIGYRPTRSEHQTDKDVAPSIRRAA